MKLSLAFALSLFAGVSLASVIAHAEVKPGCIGGCLPTALAAPTPVFPAGYQCKANWPLATVNVDCKIGAFNSPAPTFSIVHFTITNPDGSKTQGTRTEKTK